MAGLTAQDKKWQAQDDARTLAQVAEITSDKSRLQAARKEATVMLKETQKRMEGLKKVVTNSNTNIPIKRTSSKSASRGRKK